MDADSGAIGGSASHEFMVLADAGEDGVVVCEASGYAANTEKAESKILERSDPADDAAIEEVGTPGMGTITEVSGFLNQPEDRFIKTLIYEVDNQPIAVLVPGDRDVNEIKLNHVIDGSTIEMADEECVQRVTGAAVGFAGPVGLDVPVYADIRLKGIRGGIQGRIKQTFIYYTLTWTEMRVLLNTSMCVWSGKGSLSDIRRPPGGKARCGSRACLQVGDEIQ